MSDFANADVAEFTVKNGSRITKCAVKDAGLPKGATIGGLIRNGEGILVTGNTVIQPNDHVVVFCLGMMIKKIENSSIDDKCKMIARIMGALFFIEAGFLILCSFLAVYYNESDISAFLYSAAITAGAGSIAALAGKMQKENQPPRWIRYCNPCLGVFSLFGMLPFYLSGYIPTITDAFLKPCQDSPPPEQVFWTI